MSSKATLLSTKYSRVVLLPTLEIWTRARNHEVIVSRSYLGYAPR
jgi:hypothetical protein